MYKQKHILVIDDDKKLGSLLKSYLSEKGYLVDVVENTNLAKQMIELSGKTLKDENNPNGDIELVITGLRPGEKLYEELLIDAESIKTQHPLIYRANESFIPFSDLIEGLNKLEISINEQNAIDSLSILSELVPAWKKYIAEKENIN